ncbi:HK97 gp10 family phage protein [Lacticaseibacillus saniviri]
MEVEIDTSKVVNNILKLPELIQNALWDATFDIVELVQTRAVDNLQANMAHSTGELVQSLKYEVVVDSDNQVVGRVWSDNAVAAYRELGTGIHGQESPKDLPSGISPTYRQTPWFIPADAVDVDLSAVYGMPAVNIKGKRFYISQGQPARQFLVPALRSVLDGDAEKIIKTRFGDIQGGLDA